MWKTCLQPWAWTWCPRPRPFNMGVAFSSPLRRPLLVIPYRSLKIIRPIIQMLVNWTTVLRKITMVRLISRFFSWNRNLSSWSRIYRDHVRFFCQFFWEKTREYFNYFDKFKMMVALLYRDICHFSLYVRIAKHACFWDSDLALKVISRKIREWQKNC